MGFPGAIHQTSFNTRRLKNRRVSKHGDTNLFVEYLPPQNCNRWGNILGCESGDCVLPIYEKNRRLKSCITVPLNVFFGLVFCVQSKHWNYIAVSVWKRNNRNKHFFSNSAETSFGSNFGIFESKLVSLDTLMSTQKEPAFKLRNTPTGSAV